MERTLTPAIKPFLRLAVQLSNGEIVHWDIDVNAQLHLWFGHRGDNVPTCRLLRLCRRLALYDLRVVGYGTFAGEGLATHMLRYGDVLYEVVEDNGKMADIISAPMFIGVWDTEPAVAE